MPQLNFTIVDMTIISCFLFLVINFGLVLLEQYEDNLEFFNDSALIT